MTAVASQGYHATTLRSIARRIGTTPGLIVHHFASREGLFENLIDRWDEAETSEQLPPDARLEQYLIGIGRNVKIPGIIDLYTAFAAEAASPGHPSHDFFKQRFQRVRDEVANDLHLRRQQGRIRQDVDPVPTAEALIAFMDGLQLQWLFDPSIDMVDRLITIIESLGRTGRPVLAPIDWVAAGVARPANHQAAP
jgi:AcrR family transcriptional regulator